jgi:hypothetical protein
MTKLSALERTVYAEAAYTVNGLINLIGEPAFHELCVRGLEGFLANSRELGARDLGPIRRDRRGGKCVGQLGSSRNTLQPSLLLRGREIPAPVVLLAWPFYIPCKAVGQVSQ